MPAQPTSGPPAQRARPRDLGVGVGILPSGPTASIVDVAGVSVGHRTVWRDEAAPPIGRGTARTGVSVIVPFDPRDLFRSRVPAATAVLNGAGEAIGRTGIDEWGLLETPIFLTSSMAIGRACDAAVSALISPAVADGRDDALIPVVAECDDGYLNQSFPVQIDATDVDAALADAAGPDRGAPASGVVGAGTGMRAFGLKGGIGTASRLVVPGHRWGSGSGRPAGEAHALGVLVLANFGELTRLTIDGVRVGEALIADGWPEEDAPATGGTGARPPGRGADGSCIVVVATDAPLLPQQLGRLARRAGLGLARAGSIGHHGSGEIFLAFSTGLRVPRGSAEPVHAFRAIDDEYLDPLFGAVVEATEEAVLDALFSADTVQGRDGRIVQGLPIERTLELLHAAGRISAGGSQRMGRG